jgi:hypothetical protein
MASISMETLSRAESATRGYTAVRVDSAEVLARLKHGVPYLFQSEWVGDSREKSAPYLLELKNGPSDFFRYCLSAHWASAASFTSLDVETLIRLRLWRDELPTDEIHDRAETVLEAYHWDFTPVSRKWMASPVTGLKISTHHGEWFSVAVAAYASTRERDPILARRLRDAIEFEVTREAKIFLETRRAKDGVGLLLASYLIAHNLTEFDRAIEAWRIGEGDPLFEFAYRATHAVGTAAARFSAALSEAGKMNRLYMAAENQRHLTFEIPKVLRSSPDFLMPLGPFLDDWGRNLANHSKLEPANLLEIIEALYGAWDRKRFGESSPVTYAYPRAVAGILSESLSSGIDLIAMLPPERQRPFRSGLFHRLTSVTQERFQEQWSSQAFGNKSPAWRDSSN